MKKVLVTGAPGLLGSHLCAQLLERGVEVRGIALPNEDSAHLSDDVELIRGDILDVECLQAAMKGIDTVFHLAAIYRDWMPDPTPMYTVNNDGTFNVLEAARRAEVERVVYTASIVSLGCGPDAGSGGLSDETSAYGGWDINFHYSRSKYHSMRIAESFGRWGMDVRVVHPGIVFGPGDRAPTPSGRLILNIASGQTPAYVPGGASYVDARDAAAVHLLAAERGRAGERYLATAHNLTNREMVRTVAKVAGRRLIVPRVPVAAARAFVRATGRLAIARGESPAMSEEMFDFGLRSIYYDNRKSIDELGARYRPIDESIRDAIAFFRASGIS